MLFCLSSYRWQQMAQAHSAFRCLASDVPSACSLLTSSLRAQELRLKLSSYAATKACPRRKLRLHLAPSLAFYFMFSCSHYLSLTERAASLPDSCLLRDTAGCCLRIKPAWCGDAHAAFLGSTLNRSPGHRCRPHLA